MTLIMQKKHLKTKNQKGFVLTELLVVFVIVGILSVITIPVIMNSIQNMRLHSATQKLLVDIRYVRELAMSHHATYGIEVSAGGNSYQIFKWDGATKTYLTDPHRGTTLLVDYDNQSEFSGVAIDSVDLCEGVACPTTEIRINNLGRPYDAQDVAFTNFATIILENGVLTRTVRVTPETGFSEVV